MATEIRMPQLGESVTEGTIGRWLKRQGEQVAKYEPLLEVVTDKVDTEVPAPVAGTLVEILVAEGETVRVGTVIARLGAGDAAAGPPAAGPPAAAAPQPPPSPAAAPPPADGARNTFLSPVVARMVAEHGLDPAAIPGTGQGGRVTKQDVLRYLEGRDAGAEARPPAPADVTIAAPPGAEPGAEPRREPLPAGFVPPPAAPAQSLAPPWAQPPGPTHPASPQAAELPEDAELVPLTPMRRAIAEHMERSVRTAPHVTTVMEVDLSRVLAHREAAKAEFARQGVRLTLTPYFVQAVAAGLAGTPVLNGSFGAEGIVLNRRVHIGVAVALDEGLLVPVVRDADEKSLLGLARAVNDLAERARARRLRPDETQGGTFTITNHGVSGSLFATPIINQPQSAILGVGAIVKRPVVLTQGGVDAIAIRPICYLSLTFDHRIADGATADGFLAEVKEALERYAL